MINNQNDVFIFYLRKHAKNGVVRLVTALETDRQTDRQTEMEIETHRDTHTQRQRESK